MKRQGWLIGTAALGALALGAQLGVLTSPEPSQGEWSKHITSSSGVEPARATAAVAAPAPSTEPALPSRAPESRNFSPAATQAQVLRVIDGDTFEVVVLGRREKVRVLGIDSCEMSTAGGKEAKSTAEQQLDRPSVTLVAEPTAPDRDRYGRLLRYVITGYGMDLGKQMISYDHTGVYAGRNDASPSYVSELRSLDGDARNCAGTPAPATEDHYVPVPNGGGDDGESRFCGRRWWC